MRINDFIENYLDFIILPDGTHKHRFSYSLDLPAPFHQEEGTIYWISIAAIMDDSTQFTWGWETSIDHWNDYACRQWLYNDYWEEITLDMHPWYPNPRADMAFELTVPPLPPPPLEPVKWQQRPDMRQGVNIVSIPMISGERIVRRVSKKK